MTRFIVVDSENQRAILFPTYIQALNYKNTCGNALWKIEPYD